MTEGGRDLRCSFCKKPQDEVRALIAGPGVYICDGCVDVCVDIIEHHNPEPGPFAAEWGNPPRPQPAPAAGLAITCSLCRTPMPLDDALRIPERGVLCPGCIGEIEAAIAERAESSS